VNDRRPAPPPYGTIVFDCDSTLSTIEGVEHLPRAREETVHELTERAMNGELPLEAVYGARLKLIRPTRDEVTAVGRRYVETLVPNTPELFAALRFLEKRVCIVSGGLLPAVLTVGRELGLEDVDIQAVDLFHDDQGAYTGFDESSPLARAGGKLEVLNVLGQGPAARPGLALVGDGATDLEAAPACARFVAFGGVARREAVFAGADVTCDVLDMAALLPLLVSDEELARLLGSDLHRPLTRAALTLRD